MPPLIGITTSFEDGQQTLDVRYPQAVERAGGIPVLIPVLRNADAVASLVKKLDGVLIPGGPAMIEGMHGKLPDDITLPDPTRIRVDRWVLESVLDLKLPLLGICYGMQLVNAYFGGTIYADVERQCNLPAPHSERRGGVDHGLLMESGSWLQRVLGDHEITVNTRHIQSIESTGGPLRISATAPDGVIEAIESEDGTFIGVQFHPERMGAKMQPLFDYLVSRSAHQSDGSR